MVTIIDILRLIVGLALFAMGSVFVSSSPRIGGFLVGGWVAAEVVYRTIALTGTWELAGPLLAFVLGGLVGALLGNALSMVLLVVYGSVLGAMVGFILGFLTMMGGNTRQIIESLLSLKEITPLQSAFMIVLALFFGFMSLRFQEVMAMASTSFVGSGLAIFAMAGQLKRLTPIFEEDVVLLFVWVVVGLLGLMWQNQNLDH